MPRVCLIRPHGGNQGLLLHLNKHSTNLHKCMVDRPDQVTDLDEGENKEEGEEAREEGPSAFLQRDGESVEAYAARIFERVFTDDIENVLTMEVSSRSPM